MGSKTAMLSYRFFMLLITPMSLLVHTVFRKGVLLEGRVIEKNIAQNDDEDSFLTLETSSQGKVVLRFNTNRDPFYRRNGGARELDKSIALGDGIKAEISSRGVPTRDVYRLLLVTKI